MDSIAGFLPRAKLQIIFEALGTAGYRCVGPRVRDGAIVYEQIEHAADLPTGVRQTQEPGSYRLQVNGDDRCFAWANGPQALKPLLFAPREILWQVRRNTEGKLEFEASAVDFPRTHGEQDALALP